MTLYQYHLKKLFHFSKEIVRALCFINLARSPSCMLQLSLIIKVLVKLIRMILSLPHSSCDLTANSTYIIFF